MRIANIVSKSEFLQSMEDTNQLSVENVDFTKHAEKNPFITLFEERKRHIDENCEKMRTNSPKYFENHPRHLFVLKGNFSKRSNDFQDLGF